MRVILPSSLLALCLFGCAHPVPHVSQAPGVPLPPKIAPRAAKSLTSETPKSLSLVLLWTNQVPVSVLYSSNLVTWQVAALVTNQSYTLTQSAPAYFRVQSRFAPVTLRWDPSPDAGVFYHVYALHGGQTNTFDAGPEILVTIQLAPDTDYQIWATSYFVDFEIESLPSAAITYRTPAQTFLPARIRKQ